MRKNNTKKLNQWSWKSAN